MIEFKAECGHTVRARDEDAGAVVRCSYCGKNAKVPEDAERDLDALFREIQSDTPQSSVIAPAPRRKRSFFSRRKSVAGEFNPFPLIMRLVYASVLVVIVVVLYQKAVKPMLDDAGKKPRPGRMAVQQNSPQAPQDENSTRRRSAGYIGGSLGSGLFVRSTPPGAAVYCIESAKATSRGRINKIKGSTQITSEDGTQNLSDGTYVVEFVFAINDPKLTSYRGYSEFRRPAEEGSDAQRRELIESYFIPDDASDVFIADVEDQKYIVRQYRDIEIQQGQPKAVRALFLPRLAKEGQPGFSIEDLVNSYLSIEPKAYAFNESHVNSELNYHGVPEGDRRWVMEALARVGVISYVMPDGRTRIFRIGVNDGAFTQRVIREHKG